MTVRMQDSNPAEMAELDFSRLDMFHNPDADRHRAVWALIEVPTYSLCQTAQNQRRALWKYRH